MVYHCPDCDLGTSYSHIEDDADVWRCRRCGGEIRIPVEDRVFRGYRNGYHHARELTVGLAAVEVRVPRVSQVPQEVAPQGFHSQVVQRYQRASQTTQRLFARLYLEGLATGDFEPVFRELVGETTALSANTVVRLKDHWGQEYQDWRCRPLGRHRYAYIWADGIYLAAGTEQEKTALLCILGAREDGEKELLAMESGYRESTESWADVLRDLRDRGLAAPLVAVGDGALGLWAALDQVFPTTEHQRCWNHRALNLQSKLPKRLQGEARRRLKEIVQAETQALCEQRRDDYVTELRAMGQERPNGPGADPVGVMVEELFAARPLSRQHTEHGQGAQGSIRAYAQVPTRPEADGLPACGPGNRQRG